MRGEENRSEKPEGTDCSHGTGEETRQTFTEAVLASSAEMVRRLREHAKVCGEPRFNFEPTEEQLEEYFRNYKYKKIKGTQDPIIRKVKAMFECNEWRWVTVETDYFMTIAIPIPSYDHGMYRLFDVESVGREKTAAFILFVIMRLIYCADEVESWYHYDYDQNYGKWNYIFHEKACDLIEKTMGSGIDEFIRGALKVT